MTRPIESFSAPTLTIYLIFVTLASAGMALLTAPTVAEWVGGGELLTVGIGALIAGVIAWGLTRNIIVSLVRIDAALDGLAAGRTIQPFEARRDPLAPLADKVNALIRDAEAFRVQRGALAQQLGQTAAEEERKRLARDLHDSIKQQVFGMSISASAAALHLDQGSADAARQALLDVKQSAHEAMVEMRALLQQLAPAPLEKSGLVEALREQAQALAYRAGVTINQQIGTLPDDARFPIGAQEAVFRIAQESFSNIARHARAGTVHLTLTSDADAVQLRIQDDGAGFDTDLDGAGMGLHNMRTRAAAIGAALTVESAAGAGTTVALTIPLVKPIAPPPPIDPRGVAHPLGDTINRALGWFVGGVCMTLIGTPLVLNRVIFRPGTLFEDLVLVILTGIMLALSVGGIVVAVANWRVLRRLTAELRAAVTPDSVTWLKLRRHRMLAICLIAGVTLWFVPLTWAAAGVTPLATTVLAVGALIVMIWSYMRAQTAATAELHLLPPAPRLTEITRYQGMVRAAWGSTAFLVFIVVITDTARNGFTLMPPDADSWMTSALLLLTALLLVNQVVQMVYYRQQERIARRQAETEGGAAS